MSDKLITWLNQERKRRDWSYADLARKAGVSRPLISRTLTGDMSASADFCIKVAIALDVSPITSLKMAGFLPETTLADHVLIEDHTLRALMEIAQALPPSQREKLLDFARFLNQ